MNTPLSGIQYLINGFSLIFKPGLRRYVFIPLTINILLFAALFFLARHFVFEFNQWFASHVPHWLQWLSVVLWILFFISFFILFVYTYVTLGNIIAAPFNSLLAQKVETFLTGKMPEQKSLFANIKDTPRIIGRQLGIVGYYLPRALLILILFFIPVVNSVAAILWFLFNGWFMAFTYLDYPTDNHHVPLRDVRVWLKQRQWVALGFGVSVLVASMVPILNLFTIPAAVAAATKMWVEENSQVF